MVNGSGFGTRSKYHISIYDTNIICMFCHKAIISERAFIRIQ